MSNVIVGLIVLGLGLLFLLSNTGVIDFEMTSIRQLLSTYWPSLIILWGAYKTITGFFSFLFGLKLGRVRLNRLFFGLLFVGVGVILQGNKLNYFDITFSDLWSWVWPALIIYFGFQILFGKRHYNRDFDMNITSMKKDSMEDWDDVLDEVDDALEGKNRWRKQSHWIGDFHIGANPWELEDMNLWMGIGDFDLDLTKAILPEGETHIDLRGWVGDITVLVPHDMPIKANADVKVGDLTLFNHNQSGTTAYVAYTSENYQQSEKKVRLTVSLAIGQVTVKHIE